jgi:calcineurin-like phosphoesterase family protein
MIGEYPQVVVLCHYSMQVWDRSHYGSWHLFDHSHGTLKGIGLSFDVGTDCTEFAPIPLEVVTSKMAHLTPLAHDRLLSFGEGNAEY